MCGLVLGIQKVLSENLDALILASPWRSTCRLVLIAAHDAADDTHLCQRMCSSACFMIAPGLNLLLLADRDWDNYLCGLPVLRHA
jgi:hypothetical protein